MTDIIFVLDASGSMQKIRGSIIKSHNDFLRQQRSLPDEATYTQIQFNSEYEKHVDFVPIVDAPDLTATTYNPPKKWTRLQDAIGKTIIALARRYQTLAESGQVPPKVVVAILTDGKENKSEIFRGSEGQLKIAEMIREKRALGWEFVFLAANIDARAVAESYAIASDSVLNWAHHDDGAAHAMASTSDSIARFRSGVSRNVAYSANEVATAQNMVNQLKQELKEKIKSDASDKFFAEAGPDSAT